MPTRLLALETSGLYGSLALAEDGQVVADRTLSPPQRTAQSLAPAIEQLVAEVGWSIRDLSVVAVTVGPGSFTGLRVGVVTAKTLAYALGAQVVGVNTLEVIAARISNQPQLVTVLDAQRQELFVARWRWSESGEWLADEPTHLVSISDWLAQLKANDMVTGPGSTKIVNRLPATVTVANRGLWEPRAREVAAIGWREYQAGRNSSHWSLAPQYFRLSAAEEKRAEG